MWVVDPAGLAWETFLTTGVATVYGDDNEVSSSDIPLAKIRMLRTRNEMRAS